MRDGARVERIDKRYRFHEQRPASLHVLVLDAFYAIPAELPMNNDSSPIVCGIGWDEVCGTLQIRARYHLDAFVHDRTRGWQQGPEFLYQQSSGLADNEDPREAAKTALDRYACGMASASSAGRKKCTSNSRRASPRSSRWKIGPLFILFRRQCRSIRDVARREGAVISDALNHASIIDGVRLFKGQALPPRHQ